jgi:GTP-binding protein EngB required for normal cell division
MNDSFSYLTESSVKSDNKIEKETSSADSEPQSQCYNIVVLGNTGVGKSALLNYLAGQRNAFTVGDTTDAQTQLAKSRIFKLFSKPDGVRIRLVDTQGLSDTGGDQKDMEHVKNMVEHIRKLESIHLFLLCLDGCNPRFTPYLQSTVELFVNIFPDFLSHTVLVFNKWTSADEGKQVQYKLDYQSKLERMFDAKKIPCYFVDSFCNVNMMRYNWEGDKVEMCLPQKVQDKSIAQVHGFIKWMDLKEPSFCDVRLIKEAKTRSFEQAEKLAEAERELARQQDLFAKQHDENLVNVNQIKVETSRAVASLKEALSEQKASNERKEAEFKKERDELARKQKEELKELENEKKALEKEIKNNNENESREALRKLEDKINQTTVENEKQRQQMDNNQQYELMKIKDEMTNYKIQLCDARRLSWKDAVPWGRLIFGNN